MNEPALKKLPRLYVDRDLQPGQTLALPEAQAHYLRSVLRQVPGDAVRLFNGRDGEYKAVLDSVDKKSVTARCEILIRPQPEAAQPIHLLFAPIKKARLDFLIEKAVELGATHLHPIITQNTEVRTLNEDRLRLQIIEAAEQCERMDVPVLSPAQKLEDLPAFWSGETILACIERHDAPPLKSESAHAILIGPEGGFTENETAFLGGLNFIRPVSLGPRILRSETAVCAALALISL
jgi:16S rRNA (uracil1498-N3)-methyltransferase